MVRFLTDKQNKMEIDIDLNKRIEWIKARVELDALTEQYIRLQMQEAVIETIKKLKN
tara:strand:+ start:351 stop:521 length:171 start_codon:yes stop_codon:yes gene_type:complete